MNVCKYEQRGDLWAAVINGRAVVLCHTKEDARRYAELMQDHEDDEEGEGE